jgi:hypothetical protein
VHHHGGDCHWKWLLIYWYFVYVGLSVHQFWPGIGRTSLISPQQTFSMHHGVPFTLCVSSTCPSTLCSIPDQTITLLVQ